MKYVKKVLSLLLVSFSFVLVVCLAGCHKSDPAPVQLEHITIESIPNGYTLDSSSGIISTDDGVYGDETTTYAITIIKNNDDASSLNLNYVFGNNGFTEEEYKYMKRNPGSIPRLIPDFLLYIRDTTNGNWSLYSIDPDFARKNNLSNNSIIMIPTDETIQGYITISGRFDLESEPYSDLLNDAFAIADGISESSLTRQVPYTRY